MLLLSEFAFYMSSHNIIVLFFQDDKAMRYRAGFRRTDIPTLTEYHRQYTWKRFPPEQDPLLHAESLLESQTQASNGSHPQQVPNGDLNEDTRNDETTQHGEGFEQHQSQQQNGHSSQKTGSNSQQNNIGGSGDSGLHGHDIYVPGFEQTSSMRSPPKGKSKHAHGSSKVSGKKHKRQHHHQCSKKHSGGRGKGFVSEYKAQFKVWPIPSSTSATSATAGGKKDKREEKNYGKYM